MIRSNLTESSNLPLPSRARILGEVEPERGRGPVVANRPLHAPNFYRSNKTSPSRNHVACGVILLLILFPFPNTSRAEKPLAKILAAQNARADIIEKISAPTLAVFGPDGGGGGSGVIITPDGYALTNYHVTKPCGDYMRCGMNDGKLHDAVIVGIDPVGDVALIKLVGRNDWPHAELGDSDLLEPGSWCFVVGNPFLLATDFHPTVTYGIISGTHRYQYPAGTLLEYADCIQTDASINPGNSGGPLFNDKGQLVGINGRGSFEKRGRVNVGVGYAISINQIKKFYGYLQSGRIVDHATLGATVSADEDGKIIVTNILESSDAYRRGLRYDSELISLGGQSIGSVNEFKNLLGTYPKGWRIPISFRHDGDRVDTLVRLTGVHPKEVLLAKIQAGPQPIMPENPDDLPKDKDGKLPRKLKDLMEKVKKKPPPKSVANQIESRRGYANYHFNRKNVERIWENHRKHIDLQDNSDEWVLDGEFNDKPCQFILRTDEAFSDLLGNQDRVSTRASLDEQLEPEGSGGLLAALSMWRRLLTEGPERFGEVYFLGTAPGRNRDILVDILVATHDVIETRFHFDPDSGLLLHLEMDPTGSNDPCELVFDNWKKMGGQFLPQSIEVIHGDNNFGTFRLKEAKLTTEKEPVESN